MHPSFNPKVPGSRPGRPTKKSERSRSRTATVASLSLENEQLQDFAVGLERPELLANDAMGLNLDLILPQHRKTRVTIDNAVFELP